MLVRSINMLLHITSIGLNIIFITLLFYFSDDFNKKLVYDIDKVRTQYLNDMHYYYNMGCRDGVDYPDEYKEKARAGDFGFGAGSYCDEKKETHEETMLNGLSYLGKSLNFR